MGDCLAAMTGGVDIVAEFRGKFRSLAEAMILLRRAGYADLCVFLASHLEEIPPTMARAGDVMAFKTEPSGWACGVVNGERVTVMGLDGLGTVPRDNAMRAFRVP